MKQNKYDVFISYSRKDYVDELKNVIPGNVVSKIKGALSKANISYWFDEDGIYSGNEFTEKIVSNIEVSTIFLFLSTRNANASPWTSKEIACADELGKYIIPIRIDKSPYNKKVLFRIADRSYIDYYANPEKGIEEIVSSIQTHKEQIEEERKKHEEEERERAEKERKQAEERKAKHEQEEKRRRQEQDKLISNIRLSLTTLNNEETKLEIDRENLMLKTEDVTDNEQRETLKEQIRDGGTIHKKYQERYSELTKEIKVLKSVDTESLRNELKNREEQISHLKSELEASQSRETKNEKEAYSLIGQIGDLQKEVKELQTKNKDGANKKNSKWVHITYGGIILSILTCAIIWLINVYRESDYWLDCYDRAREELRESDKAKETLSSLSNIVPFIITDVEVKNTDEEWGDKIYSSKSTYLIPRIKYVGLKEDTYKIGVKNLWE